LSLFDLSHLYFKKPLVEVKKTSTEGRKPIIFWRALFHAYKGKLIAGGLMKLVHDIFQFSGPMILKYNNLVFIFEIYVHFSI